MKVSQTFVIGQMNEWNFLAFDVCLAVSETHFWQHVQLRVKPAVWILCQHNQQKVTQKVAHRPARYSKELRTNKPVYLC